MYSTNVLMHMILTKISHTLQVFAIEFIILAIELITFTNYFVPLVIDLSLWSLNLSLWHRYQIDGITSLFHKMNHFSLVDLAQKSG